MQTINKIINAEEEPDFSGVNATTLYTDSSYLKVKVQAPVIERFVSAKPPKTLFNEGVTAFFYDKQQQVESQLSADWAMLNEQTEIWEARGHVEIQKNNGDRLLTEVLFWDQHEGLIYNSDFTQVYSEGTSYRCKNGIRAAQNFSWWSCTSSLGEIEFVDHPQPVQDTLWHPADTLGLFIDTLDLPVDSLVR